MSRRQESNYRLVVDQEEKPRVCASEFRIGSDGLVTVPQIPDEILAHLSAQEWHCGSGLPMGMPHKVFLRPLPPEVEVAADEAIRAACAEIRRLKRKSVRDSEPGMEEAGCEPE